jgi:hypothetical protein
MRLAAACCGKNTVKVKNRFVSKKLTAISLTRTRVQWRTNFGGINRPFLLGLMAELWLSGVGVTLVRNGGYGEITEGCVLLT